MTSLSLKADEWIAVTENFPPYNFIENGEPSGYATSLVKRLAAEASINISIELLPWSRAMLKAESKPKVLIYSILRTPEREQKYHWIGPIDDMSFYVWKYNHGKVGREKAPERLSYAVAGSLDQLNSQMLNSALDVKTSKVIALETTDQIIGMLLKDRVDRVVLAENIWRKLRRSLDKNIVAKMERVELVAERQLYIASSLHTNAEDVTRLQGAFKKISEEADFALIRDSHGLN